MEQLPGYDKYKKYITNAQKKKLVAGAQRFNNQFADERVDALAQNRAQVNQERAYLQNRGLAGNGAPFHSGQEALVRQQADRSFTQYNDRLRQAQDAQTEALAAKLANDTKRARARANALKQYQQYLDAQTNGTRDELMNGTSDEAKAFQKQVKQALGKNGMDTLRGGTYTSRTEAENVQKYMAGLSKKELAALDTDPSMAVYKQEIIDSVGRDGYDALRSYYGNGGAPSFSSFQADTRGALDALRQQGGVNSEIADQQNALLNAVNNNAALSQEAQQDLLNGINDRVARAGNAQPVDEAAVRAQWMDENYRYSENNERITELTDNLKNIGKGVENAQRLVDHYTGLSKTRQLTMDEWEQMEQASYYIKNADKIAEQWAGEITTLERKNSKAEQAWDQLKTFYTSTVPQYAAYDVDAMERLVAERKAAGDTAGADEAGTVLAYKLSVQKAGWEMEAQANGGKAGAPYAYHGDPADYTFDNASGSKYYAVVNDNKALLWWRDKAESALLKSTQGAVSEIAMNGNGGGTLAITLIGGIKGIATGKGWAKGIAELTDTSWTEEEYKAYTHAHDQDVFLAEYASFMTEEEKNTYNYVYNTYGAKDADRYFEGLFAELDARGADKVSESAEQLIAENGKEGKILGTIVRVPLNFVLSAVSPATTLYANSMLPDGQQGSQMVAAKNNYAQLISGEVSKDMSESGKFFYGVATSMMDSFFAAGLSGNAFGGGAGVNIGGLVLGMSAYNSTYQEGLARGLDVPHATATAVMAGVIEMITEKYSIESFLSLHEGQFMRNLAKQGTSEASEEFFSSGGNLAVDLIFNGDKAKIRKEYEALVASGDYDEKGAFWKVLWNTMGETGMETLAGFVSGVGSATAHGLTSSIASSLRGEKSSAQYAEEGRALRSNEEAMAKLQEHEFTSEYGQAVMEQAESLEKASDAEIARLNDIMQMEDAAAESVTGVKGTEGAVDALKDYRYRDAEAQRVQEKETLSDTDIAFLAQERVNQEMQDAAQALSSNQEAMKTYPVFTKIANGQTITMEEAQLLAGNDAAMAFFTQKYGAATGADGVMQNATMAARKVQQTYGTLKDAQVSGTTARKAEKIFRDASTIADDTKTQDFKTRRGSVQVALRSGDTRYFSSQQKAAIGLCIAAANATGANIVVRDTFRTSENQRLKDTPRGFYSRETNTIEIALDSDQSVAYVLGHELVHYMEHTAGESYAAFRDIVFNALDKVDVSKLDADLQRTIRAAREQNPELSVSEAMKAYENKRQGGKLSDKAQEGEVLAEAGSAMLLQKSVQKEIARLNNVTVAERIVEFAQKMGEEIRRLLGAGDFTGEEYNMLKDQADTMRKMEAAYRAMLLEANRNAGKQMEKEQAPAKTEPKQEPRKKLNGANEAVLKVARSITENYKGFNLNKLSGQIAAAYRMAVGGDADSAMAEVRKIAADIAHTAKMEKESVNQEQYGALKSALEDFRHAYVEEADRADSAYKTGSIRAFNNAMRAAGINFSLVTNENIDAPKLEDVYRQMTEHGMYGDVNQFGDMLPRDINVKDMAQTLLDAAQRLKPDHTLVLAYEALGTTEAELADSIADDLAQGFADVQLSVRQRDDQYMKLAEKKRYTATDEKQMRKSVEDAAEEAMKNSKVRGEDGKLLVVYHGTDEDFTVFDIGKGRASMDIQGAFFSPYMDDAEGYGGKVGAYYLNITNPADEKTAREVFQKYRKENNAGIKARQELEAMGYDGVINEDEYIAFRPEQIKSADLVTRDDNGNIIPLSQRFNQDNPDIRYSVRSNEKNAFNPNGLTLHDQLQDSFDSAESFDHRYIYVGEFEGWFLKALSKYVKVEGLPIVMNYRDAYLAMHTKETGKYHGDGINYHSLGVYGLQNALENIDRTNAVMISKKGPDKIEIALDTVDGKNQRCLSIVSINTVAQSSGTHLASHVVTSIYGKRNIDRYIKAAEDEGREIKIEAPASVRSQVQYEGAMITGASDERIPEASEDVKQYSVRDEKKGEPYRNVVVDQRNGTEVRGMEGPYQNDAVAEGGTFVQEYTDNAPEVHVPETWVNEYTDNRPTVYHDETRVYFSDGDGTRAAMEQNVEQNLREVTEEIIEPFAELNQEDWHSIIAQTRNANFLKQMPVERVLDAICGKNAELRQKMYELVEKPFNEAGGKFARSREAMFQRYTKAMDDLGIKTREQSAAIQRIGEHSYQHKCTVQAWETGDGQYHVRVVEPEQLDVKKQTVTDGQRTFAIEDGRIPIAFRVSDDDGNMVDVPFTLHTDGGKQTITLHHNVHGETELFTAGQEGVKEYNMSFREVMTSFQGYGRTIASKAAKYTMAKNSPHAMTDSAYAPYTLDMLQNDHPDDWNNIVEAEKISRRMYDEYVDSINKMLEEVYPMVYEKDEQTIEQLQAKVNEAREDSANQRELISRIKAAIEQGQATIATMDNTTQEYADAQHSLAVVEQRLKDATKKLAKLTRKAELREAKLTEYQAMVASGDTLRNKRLQKRSDYYHHFQELTDNVVVNLRNILKTNTDIDPQLVNISDQTKPKSKWTEFLQQRVGGAYTEDAVNGMYKYIAGAEYILAYDPLISRFREMQKQYDKATREMKGSSDTILDAKNANNFMRWMNAWVNNIAGKTHDIDRVISNEMGDRRALKFIQKLNGLGKSAKLLFNARSALVQVSNMTNAAIYVDAVDWKNGWFNCVNAMKGKEMAEILSKSNFVSQRLAEVPVFEEATIKSKAMHFANWMLSAGDSFSTQMTWWAAYNQYERIGADAADAKGYRHYEDAIDYADDITRRTHGGRGVGELPVTLQSKLVNLFAPFQVEVLNTFENLVQVIGKKDALGIAKMQCSIFAFNMVTRCIFGDGVLGFDFIHALLSILKDVFYPEDKDEKLQDHLQYASQQLLGELVSGIPFAAQAATFLVPDENARERMFGDSDPTRYGTGTIGLSFIAEMVNVYNDLVNGKDVSWDLLDATVGNYMTGGSQIMRTAKGLYTWKSGYSADKKGNVQFAIDQDATELVLMAIFGKWAVPEAREYLGSLDPIADAAYDRTAPGGKSPSISSEKQVSGYKAFTRAGGSGKDFIKIVKLCGMAEGQKDENGRTISGSVKAAKIAIIDSYGLTQEQRSIVMGALGINE